MTLPHPVMIDLLKKPYSAEKAAAFAYQGHASSVKDYIEKKPFVRLNWMNGNTGSMCAELCSYSIFPFPPIMNTGFI